MAGNRYHTFLSHNSDDKPAVVELAHRLRKEGIEPWLDEWNLVPGKAWQPAIEQALDDCDTCTVFIGPSGLGPWQNEEMRAAIGRRVSQTDGRFRVIPVVLPGGQRDERSRLPTFLKATTWVEFRQSLDDDEPFRRMVCGIRGIEPGPGPDSIDEGICPYRGLQAFLTEHARFFFGREALNEWLLDMLRTAPGSGAENRFLAIIGASGSGKSSLARAGLVPALKRGELDGSQDWPVVVLRPGQESVESLAVALAAEPVIHKHASPTQLMADLAADERTLHLTTRLALHGEPETRRVVVLVDQFEEIFSLCDDDALRRALIDNLLYAAHVAGGQTVVVLTMRADFYGKCAGYDALAAALSDHQVLVGPMNDEELRRAIERPAQIVGCELEAGLTQILIRDVADQAGALPLLQHALEQLWERRDGRRLTCAAYEQIGGLQGALERRANEIFEGFNQAEREICRRVFLRLTQPGEGTEDTKRRTSFQELLPAGGDATPVEQVVQRLAETRLITTEGDEAGSQARFVEVAHEALIRGWSKLRGWIESDRESLRIQRRLSDDAARWHNSDRDNSYLYVGVRLAQAREWASPHATDMSMIERSFLQTSRRRARRGRIMRFGTTALVIAMAATVLGVSWKVRQKTTAQQWIGDARTLLEERRSLDEAYGLLSRAIDVRPENEEAYYYRALADAMRGLDAKLDHKTTHADRALRDLRSAHEAAGGWWPDEDEPDSPHIYDGGSLRSLSLGIRLSKLVGFDRQAESLRAQLDSLVDRQLRFGTTIPLRQGIPIYNQDFDSLIQVVNSTSPDDLGAEPDFEATIHRAVDASIGNLNPILAQGNAEVVTELLFDTLVNIGPKGKYHINESMVAPIVPSGDQNVTTLTLQPNLVWHDGRPLTADDVVFSWQQLLELDKPRPEITDITLLDSLTIQIHHERPLARPEWDLYFPIISKRCFEDLREMNKGKTAAELHILYGRQRVIGNGPYRHAVSPAGQINLERWNDYPGDPPHFKHVQFEVIRDRRERFGKLAGGRIHQLELKAGEFQWNVTGDSFSDRIKKIVQPSYTYDFICWNLQSPLFEDERVRLAIALAINIQRVIDIKYSGLYEHGCGMYPKEAWMANENLKPYSFDPTRAAALLDQAGWRMGADGVRRKDGRRFEFEILVPEKSNESRSVLTDFRIDLKEVGILMHAEPLPRDPYRQRTKKGSFDAFIGSVIDSPHPDQSKKRWMTNGTRNFGFYHNKEVDELYSLAREEPRGSTQTKYYNKIHEIIHNEQPYIFLWHRRTLWAVSPRLRIGSVGDRGLVGFHPGPRAWWFEKDAE